MNWYVLQFLLAHEEEQGCLRSRGQGFEELEMQSHGIATKPKGVKPTYLSRYLVKETPLLKMQQTQTSPPLIQPHLQSIDPNTGSFP